MVDFEPGDVLVLITDGFFEQDGPAEQQFGTDNLKDVIRAHRHESAEGIIRAMRDAVMTFAAHVPQQDDLTAVVIQRSRAPSSE